jgi:antitoxin CcdA
VIVDQQAEGQRGRLLAADSPKATAPDTPAASASAKLLKINISRSTEDGLKRAEAARQAEFWLEANRAALESSNAHVDQKGLPPARFRNF